MKQKRLFKIDVMQGKSKEPFEIDVKKYNGADEIDLAVVCDVLRIELMGVIQNSPELIEKLKKPRY